MITCGPHDFKPIKLWDNWGKDGRCLHCFLPKSDHPVKKWVRARPFNDKSEAESSAENWGLK